MATSVTALIQMCLRYLDMPCVLEFVGGESRSDPIRAFLNSWTLCGASSWQPDSWTESGSQAMANGDGSNRSWEKSWA